MTVDRKSHYYCGKCSSFVARFLEMCHTPDALTLLRQMPLCLHVEKTP